MDADRATFEVRHRGRRIAAFTGPRDSARAEAEARCREFGTGKLAWIKEVDPERGTKRVLNALWTAGLVFAAFLMLWYG